CDVERAAQRFHPLPNPPAVAIAKVSCGRVDQKHQVQRPPVATAHRAGERELDARNLEGRRQVAVAPTAKPLLDCPYEGRTAHSIIPATNSCCSVAASP